MSWKKKIAHVNINDYGFGFIMHKLKMYSRSVFLKGKSYKRTETAEELSELRSSSTGVTAGMFCGTILEPKLS